MTPDKQIYKEVTTRLTGDKQTKDLNIKASVKDGTVSLSGTVPSYAARQLAALRCWSVPGVVQVNNAIEVQEPNTLPLPTDNQILTETKRSLESVARVRTSRLNIEVNSGVVKLVGAVDKYWEKNKAEEVIANIAGVINIINEITVVPTQNITDEAISLDIIKALELNQEIDAESIFVEVNNGVATISGTVPDWQAYQTVLSATSNTVGVVSIINHLSVQWESLSGFEHDDDRT